jgi:cyclase
VPRYGKLLCVCAGLLVWADPCSPQAPSQKSYDVVPLAGGVYGFVWKDPLQDPIEGNSLFIINDRDVVVVDTGILPSSARTMADELRKLTSKPVRYVVNTHWHDDHHNGNQVYRELWPAAEFIAHRDTRIDMFAQTYDTRAEDVKRIEDDVARYERWSKTGKDDDGKPIDEARRKRMAEVAAVYGRGVTELRTVRNTPPDLTFVDRITLHRGERTIEIRWLGRGNTRGDVVVFLPAERIAATGDLLVNPLPFGFGSFYEEWAETLDQVDQLPADILFPGHGAIQRDRVYLHQVRDLLLSLVSQVRAAVSAGSSLEETKEKVTLSEWKEKFAGSDPRRQRSFDVFFTAPAVERAWYQEMAVTQKVK